MWGIWFCAMYADNTIPTFCVIAKVYNLWETKLDPGSQLVCVLMQPLVIFTTVRIFVVNLCIELVSTL